MKLEARVSRTTGRTVHRVATLVSGQLGNGGTLAIPVRVRIEPTDAGFLLLYLDGSGRCQADTWHATIEDAKRQAAFEFEINEPDWIEKES